LYYYYFIINIIIRSLNIIFLSLNIVQCRYGKVIIL